MANDLPNFSSWFATNAQADQARHDHDLGYVTDQLDYAENQHRTRYYMQRDGVVTEICAIRYFTLKAIGRDVALCRFD